jgi:hypothetical protein
MNWLRKVEGRQTPPGMELQILRKLPRITLAGTLLILALPALSRLLPPDPAADVVKQMRSVDIFAIAAGISFLTLVFTVAIGCVIVHIMKGPAYAADSMPVAHADRPQPPPERADDARQRFKALDD